MGVERAAVWNFQVGRDGGHVNALPRMDWQAWNGWVFGGCRTIEAEANEHVFGPKGGSGVVDAAAVRGMASMREREAIGGSATAVMVREGSLGACGCGVGG